MNLTIDGVLEDDETYETTLSVKDIGNLLMTDHFYDDLSNIIEECFKLSKLKADVPSVIPTLCGGSMRIIELKAYLTDYLYKNYNISNNINYTLNFDESVSLGCTYYGAMKEKLIDYKLEYEDIFPLNKKNDKEYESIIKEEIELEEKDKLYNELKIRTNVFENIWYNYITLVYNQIKVLKMIFQKIIEK